LLGDSLGVLLGDVLVGPKLGDELGETLGAVLGLLLLGVVSLDDGDSVSGGGTSVGAWVGAFVVGASVGA